MNEYISDERIYTKEFMEYLDSLTDEEFEIYIKALKEKENAENNLNGSSMLPE